MPFAPSGNHLGANLSFTKFLFIIPRATDDAVGMRLKGIGGLLSRGFFNDFGAERTPRYTSGEMYDYAYRTAMTRTSGRTARNVFVLPVSKNVEWWQKPAL